MSLLVGLASRAAIPVSFPSPFGIDPCELAKEAARSLQARLPQLCSDVHDFHSPGGGKMMGVLVVRQTSGELCYMSAFSGMLRSGWTCAEFVSPVFSAEQRNTFLDKGESKLAQIRQSIERIESCHAYQVAQHKYTAVQDQCTAVLNHSNNNLKLRRQQRAVCRDQINPDLAMLVAESREDKRVHRDLKKYWHSAVAEAKENVDFYSRQIKALAKQRRELSQRLQSEVFDGYNITSFSGETRSLRTLFGTKAPPAGAGDCAAVKLFNQCIALRLTPVCMTEFWWGAAPQSGIRHHGSYYPSCRGRCGVILPFMLQGIKTLKPPHDTLPIFTEDEPSVVFEDSQIVVVNKPAGMLSVPGKVGVDSVEYRLRARYPQANNRTLLVHRLDQATSGLLLAAKTKEAHRILQSQFQQRQVEKRYCAILSSNVASDSGEIDLPLRVDLDDRPRQLVCFEHGKQTRTRYRVIKRMVSTTRVEFTPVTGRTHQLRLHAAHPHGLNAPIAGDELYGSGADRLYLHAEFLEFSHPVSSARLNFSAPAPF